MLCLITNRKLCSRPLPLQVEAAIRGGVGCVILREKDLDDGALLPLALEIAGTCRQYKVGLLVNSSVAVARQVDAWGVQLPLPLFRQLRDSGALAGLRVGVSVHSATEAVEARDGGAHHVLAGHVFETRCKEGLEGRGLDFVAGVRRAVDLPLWTVGGIFPDNAGAVLKAGADVLCVMSTLLQAEDPEAVAREYIQAMGKTEGAE